VVALAAERPGLAILVTLAALAPALLARRAAGAWPLPALAPLLGLAALAGAYPALAGRARRARTRAGLGAAGAVWVLLAAPALGRALALGDGRPPRGWDDTPGHALSDVVWPLVTSGAAGLVALWAAAALVLPWLVRGRSLVLDVVAATTWAAGLAAATQALAVQAGARPTGIVAGGIAAGALAVLLPRALPRARDTVDPQ
jgi:hypothetical protein